MRTSIHNYSAKYLLSRFFMQLMKHLRAVIREDSCPQIEKLRKQRVCLLAELMFWMQ